MKKRFLVYINVLLGTVSLALAGCHAQKNAAKPTAEMECKYGVPAEWFDPQYTQPKDSLQADSTQQQPAHPVPPMIVKYGARPNFIGE